MILKFFNQVSEHKPQVTTVSKIELRTAFLYLGNMLNIIKTKLDYYITAYLGAISTHFY